MELAISGAVDFESDVRELRLNKRIACWCVRIGEEASDGSATGNSVEALASTRSGSAPNT